MDIKSNIDCFGAAQPAGSVFQSNCVMVDQPQKVFSKGHMGSNCPKAYKDSSNVLKEMVKLT